MPLSFTAGQDLPPDELGKTVQFSVGASTSPLFLLFLPRLKPIDLLPWCILGMEAILVLRGP